MSIEPSPFLPQTTIAIEKVKLQLMRPIPVEKSLDLKHLDKYNRISNIFYNFLAKFKLSETLLSNLE